MSKESTEAKLNKLKAEVEGMLSDFRHSAQHHRNTSQTAGEHNSSSTWHQGSSDAYRRVSERMEEWQQSVNQLVDELIRQQKDWAAYRNNIDEALNSGDGTYKP